MWQQQVDDHVWENTGKPVCLFCEEWSDLFGNTPRQYYCVCDFQSVKGHGLDSDQDDTKRRTSSTFDSGLRVATIFASDSCGMDRHSGYFCDHRQKHLPHRIVPSRHMYREKLVKELEVFQKPNVDGVFLDIATQTYASSFLLRHFSNVKSLVEISSQRFCRATRMSLTDQRVNCLRVFHLEAFRFLMERGLKKVP